MTIAATAAVLSAVTAQIARAQRPDFAVTCGSKALSIACDTALAGRDTVALQFVVRNGAKRGILGVRVTFGATSGTVVPASLVTDSTGTVVALWSGSTVGDGSAAVYAVADRGGFAAQQSYVLHWAEHGDSLFLRPTQWNLAGNAGHVLPRLVRVAIVGSALHGQKLVDECERQRVVFAALVPESAATASASADTVSAVYSVAGDRNGNHCFASARWRLAPDPGVQQLHAALVGAPRVTVRDAALHPDRSFTDISAIAYAPARFVIGLASTFRRVWTLRTSDESLTRPVQPFVGADFTIEPSLVGDPEGVMQFLDRLRWVVATSMFGPGRDGFIGLDLAPMVKRSAALDAPLQLTVGSRIVRSGGHFFLAVTYDASGLLSSIPGMLKPGG